VPGQIQLIPLEKILNYYKLEAAVLNKSLIPKLDWYRINLLIELALKEDIETGDATTIAVVPENIEIEAKLVTRETCVCAGLPIAEAVFKKLDYGIKWNPKANEGDLLQQGDILASMNGSARAILTTERTALNFIQRISGIATASYKYAAAVSGTSTKILDTRKTTPGWRNVEKYAVAIGGSTNHRMGLYDRIMIKDNHRIIAGLEGEGGILRSVEKSRKKYPQLEIEVEADSLDEFREALKSGAEYILLDNMTNEQMAEAVKINNGQARLEASGGITLERIPSIAALGVDFISVGALTHSVRAIDISLEM